MNLSPNFTLAEFTRSQTAERHGIDMSPSMAVIERLTWLCGTFLEPIRKELDAPIMITSGYRPPELNKRIGGSRSSAHMLGLAADFVLGNGITPLQAFEVIQAMQFPTAFDQLIYEYRWVHLGVMTPPRGQVLEIDPS